MTALAGYVGSVLITSTPNVALTNEVLTDAGDHQTFNEPTASKRYWDRTASFTVQTAPDGVTWTTATPGTYTIRYVTGQVVFNTPVSGATPSCRISSGAYLPYSTLGQGKDWECIPAMDMLDSTTLQGYGGSHWKTYVPSLQGASIKLTRFWADSTFWTILQNTPTNLLIVSLVTGRTSTGDRYEGYARVKQDDIKLSVSALVEEGLDMDIDGQLYYFAN